MSLPSIQEQSDFYDRRWAAVAKRRDFQHLKNRVSAIRRILPTLSLHDPSILEVGSGVGRIAGELTQFGRVEGIELSPKGVEIAQRSYPNAKFFAGDLFSYDFGGRRYDLVVTSEVIEHVPVEKRERFAQIIWERCEPGGYLILTTPNKHVSDKLQTDQLIENHFTEQDLKRLLGRYFDIDTLTTIQTFFPVLCSKHKLFQALRIFVYEVLGLRERLEDPFKGKKNGLYFVVVARAKHPHRVAAHATLA